MNKIVLYEYTANYIVYYGSFSLFEAATLHVSAATCFRSSPCVATGGLESVKFELCGIKVTQTPKAHALSYSSMTHEPVVFFFCLFAPSQAPLNSRLPIGGPNYM